MPLFKRKTEELIPPPEMANWSKRLGSIGDAIDSLKHDVRDVSIVTEGGPGDSGAIVNVLGVRIGQSHAGWTPMMYSFARGTGELPSLAESTASSSVRSAGVPPRLGEWGIRLRAIGALLDASHERIRAVTVVDLQAGAVVNAIVPEPTFGASSTIRSFEFPNDRIKQASAPFLPSASVQSRPFTR